MKFSSLPACVCTVCVIPPGSCVGSGRWVTKDVSKDDTVIKSTTILSLNPPQEIKLKVNRWSKLLFVKKEEILKLCLHISLCDQPFVFVVTVVTFLLTFFPFHFLLTSTVWHSTQGTKGKRHFYSVFKRKRYIMLLKEIMEVLLCCWQRHIGWIWEYNWAMHLYDLWRIQLIQHSHDRE